MLIGRDGEGSLEKDREAEEDVERDQGRGKNGERRRLSPGRC